MSSARDQSGSDQPTRLPITARLLLRESLTARRAAAIIAGVTLAITLAGGVLERVLDRREYPTIGRGLWFALQTVTTVGYGDVTPRQTEGRVIATVVMLAGIGFLAVITASVTASLVESSRRRVTAPNTNTNTNADTDTDLSRRLGEMSDRLARIEAVLQDRTPGESSGGVS